MNQIQNYKQNRFRSFEIGDWYLFGICDLEFGILNAMRFAPCPLRS
jgi:hypothetical protein